MEDFKKKFGKIYDQYIDKIYRFIFLKVSYQETAEDLTSETFLRAFEAFKKKAEKGELEKIQNPRAFLYKIARNLVVDYYRQKQNQQTISAENMALADPRQDIQDAHLKSAEIENIKRALSKLNDEYQNALVWYYLEDIPIKEIAQMLDRTEPATRVLIHRALNSLKEKLQVQKV